VVEADSGNPAGLRADTWQGRRVLVTGHTGFKGAWLTLWLARMGAQVSGISLPEPVSNPNLYDLAGVADLCRDHRQDLACDSDLSGIVKEIAPEVVFHLAAQPLVRRSYVEPRRTFASNVMGTVNLLEALRGSTGVRAVIAVTSDKCYQNDGVGRPFAEGDPLGGSDPYSASKAAQEMVVAGYRALPQMPVMKTVRAGNTIGGGDWAQDRLIPDMARAYAAGRVVEIRHPSSVRPWQHVLECLSGYLQVAACTMANEALAETYNIGPATNVVLTVGEVAELFSSAWVAEGGEASGCADASAAQAGQPTEAGLLCLDTARARADLGWSPRFTPHEAVAQTAKWYYAQARRSDARSLCEAEIDAYLRRHDATASG